MAKGKYLQITFEFSGPPKIEEVKPAFDHALDWARIAPNAWIVWTTSTPAQWYERLKPKIGPGDRFYIFEVNNSVRHGWGAKWIWEWLDKKRD